MGGSRTWRIRSLTVKHGPDGLWDASDGSKVVARRSSPSMTYFAGAGTQRGRASSEQSSSSRRVD